MTFRSTLGGFTLCLLFLCVALPSSAQELYVSNRPFKGEVSGSGSDLMVELEPLAQALKLDLAIRDGQVQVKEKSLPVTVSSQGKNFVLLDQFAAAAGLTVRKNPDFGHIDVYASTAAPAGQWGEAASSDGASPRGATSLSGAVQSDPNVGYTLQVPSDYQLINDRETMEQLTKSASESAGSGLPDGMIRTEFVLSPKKGVAKTGSMMLMTMQFPGAIPAKMEPELTQIMTEAMAEKGQLISGPTTTSINGKKFSRSTLKTQEDGVMTTLEVNIHTALAQGRTFMLMLVDAEANFPKSSIELRTILETFKITI